MILKLHDSKKIKPGHNLILEIRLPSKKQSISLLAHIKWTKPSETTAGAKIKIIKQSDNTALLEHAYAQVLERERQS